MRNRRSGIRQVDREKESPGSDGTPTRVRCLSYQLVDYLQLKPTLAQQFQILECQLQCNVRSSKYGILKKKRRRNLLV